MWNRDFAMVVLGQIIVPVNLIGKVISCAMCIGMCATPLGQAIYGGLFEILQENVSVLFFGAAVLTMVLSLALKKSFVIFSSLLNQQ